MISKNTDFPGILDKLLEWSIYIMIFALPFSKSIIEICISIGIVLLVTKKILTKDYKLLKTSANIPLLFVFLTTALSLFNSEFMGLSVRALFSKNLKFIALYFIVVEAIDTRVKVMNLLKIGMISAIVVFADTLIQYFITHTDPLHNYLAFKYVFNVSLGEAGLASTEYFIGYPTGPFPFPSDLSAWLLIVMPVLLFISLFDLKNKLSRYPVMALSLVGIYIFVLAKARGAWLAFILAMSVLIFLIKEKMVVLLVLTIMVTMISVMFLGSWNILIGLSSAMDRGDMWNNGVKIFKEHPVIGNGINTFFNKYRYVRIDVDRGRGSYAHNCYLQMASDTGLLGLAAFLWFVFSIMKKGISYIKKGGDEFYHAAVLGLVIGITGFLLHSFVDTNLYSLNLATLFWFSAGFLIAIIRTAESAS